MKKSTKFFDFICFVIGPCIFIPSLLNFSLRGGGSFSESSSVAYYYSDESLLWITVGVALIAIGFLRKHWGRQPKLDNKNKINVIEIETTTKNEYVTRKIPKLTVGTKKYFKSIVQRKGPKLALDEIKADARSGNVYAKEFLKKYRDKYPDD